jgi:hypothetical protein
MRKRLDALVLRYPLVLIPSAIAFVCGVVLLLLLLHVSDPALLAVPDAHLRTRRTWTITPESTPNIALSVREWSSEIYIHPRWTVKIHGGRKHITKLRLPSGEIWGRRTIFSRWEKSRPRDGLPFPERFRLAGNGDVRIRVTGTRE